MFHWKMKMQLHFFMKGGVSMHKDEGTLIE